ncbi:MAG: fumarylacetoacetate hydrolase family protein, partial [Candidatus Kapaibacterium sp.]
IGFYTSAPVSEFVSATNFNGKIPDFSLELSVNNQLRQQDSSAEMERSISQLIKYLAEVFTLRRGDMIFTGTPSGVGKIEHNDKITAELKGYKKLSVGVTRC